MKFGICGNALLGHNPTAREVIQAAQLAEKLGYHSIVVGDHVLTPNQFDDSNYPAGTFDSAVPWYDVFIFLATIAGATTTIRLGTGIAVVPYRPPVQQAQTISTLDFLSEGRFFYGAGVGWMREEFEALGIPFQERGPRTDEYLEAMKSLLSGTGEGFNGQFVQFPGVRLSPLPAQKPHPPIIIGGETQPAMRRIAKYGDGFYINWKTVPELERFLAELAVHMATNQRDMSSLYKQVAITDIASIRAEKDRLSEYGAMGVDELIFVPKCHSPQEGLDVMKAFADEFF